MKNKTCIIDLGLGNIKSVFNALEYLNGNNKLSNKRDFIKTKEKVSAHAQKTSEQTDYVIL